MNVSGTIVGARHAVPLRQLFAQKFADIPGVLADALFVFDHGDTHILIAVCAESYAGTDGNLGFAEQLLAELNSSHPYVPNKL